MMKSRIICILLLLVGVSGIYAQSLTVTGKVVDNEGLEVIGGNVTVKGNKTRVPLPISMVNTPLPLVIRRKMFWSSLLSDWKIWK